MFKGPNGVTASTKRRPEKQRWSHASKGVVLRSRDTGLVFVPYKQIRGGWYVVPIFVPNGVYNVGGSNILIFDREIEMADTVLDAEMCAAVINGGNSNG